MTDFDNSADRPENSSCDCKDCGVSESQFPIMGKCCNKKITAEGAEHENICPYCGVWMSLPDGGSLEVATIYECARYGYGKRAKE